MQTAILKTDEHYRNLFKSTLQKLTEKDRELIQLSNRVNFSGTGTLFIKGLPYFLQRPNY